MSLLLSVFCISHSLNLHRNRTDPSPPLTTPSSSSLTFYHLFIVYVTCAFVATLTRVIFFGFPERIFEKREERVVEEDNEEERRIETEIIHKIRRMKLNLNQMYISLHQMNTPVNTAEDCDDLIKKDIDAVSLTLERLSGVLDKKTEYAAEISEIDIELRALSNNDRISPQVIRRIIEQRRELHVTYLRTTDYVFRLINENHANIMNLAAVVDEYTRSHESA